MEGKSQFTSKYSNETALAQSASAEKEAASTINDAAEGTKAAKEKHVKEKAKKKPKSNKNRKMESKFGRKFAFMLMAVIILPSLLTGLLIFTQFKAYVQDDIYANNETVLTTVDEYVENHLNSIGKMATILSKVDYVQNMQPLLVKSMFNNVLDEFDLLQNIQVVDKTGKIVFSSDGVIGNLEAPYFDEAMAGNTAFSGVEEVETPNGVKRVIKEALPVRRNSDINGVLIVSISIDKFNMLIQQMTLQDNLEIVIVDQAGHLIANSNPERTDILQNENLLNYEPFNKAVSGENSTVAYTFDETAYLTSYNGIDLLGWGVVAQVPEKQALSHISQITVLFGVVIVLLAVGALILSAILTMYITTPLNRLSENAASVASGDFSINVKKEILKRDDEFGDLGKAFNNLVESFRGIVSSIKQSTDILDDTTITLVNSAESSNTTLGVIIDNSQQLKSASHEDIELSSRVVNGVEEMAKGSENVALNTEKLNVLIKNNVEFATAGEAMMAKTSDLVQETFRSYESIEARIKTLEKSAVDIGGITDTIMAISNQTNLLALNAAIEAARAGEAGKGFAVVAGEIRNLADQSNKSAENITVIIKDIQTDVNETSHMFKKTSAMLENVVVETEKTVSQITEILTDSKNAAGAVDEISAVTEEQAASSAQISEMMTDMRNSINTTAVVADEMSSHVGDQKVKTEETIEIITKIKDLSDELKQITEQFKC
ncbi:methyl-accepting chemotaxis protein [Fusibacter paucivorans]|uniref:Methyl-accepting chemotaxis protein n=1 Tax=Fusibacter paucivorans TaxID=76009 RepID=A0ABS5PW14_9FIRM|nr:methyl-accepting chemotaxis protein [Fusibacter paucivorans]MBS7528799.1 methyl-accepting chemotaxis protein [Fusibacter paucivorans]